MLNKDEIMAILPHRAPFLLIDEITELEPGARAVATKLIAQDEFWVQGHFPGNPVMPGVLIIEALAQTGAVAVLTLECFKGKTGYLAGLDGARFKRRVLPGELLTLTVEITKLRGALGFGTGVASVGGELAAKAEFTFGIS